MSQALCGTCDFVLSCALSFSHFLGKSYQIGSDFLFAGKVWGYPGGLCLSPFLGVALDLLVCAGNWYF
jgi:hypothetical protein